MFRRFLAAVLAALLTACPAGAQLLTTGTGPGGFGSGVAFSPSAVLFPGYTGWRVNVGTGISPTGGDSTTGLMCFDMKGSVGTHGQANASPAYAASTSQSANLRDWVTNLGASGTNSESVQGINIGSDNNVDVGRGVLNLNDNTNGGTTNGTGITNHSIQSTYSYWQGLLNNEWVTICWAWDGTTPTSGGKQAVYVQVRGSAVSKLSSGYVKATNGVIASPPLIINFSNVRGFGVAANAGNSPFSSFGYYEIGRLWVDVQAQTAGLLDASSNLSSALLNKLFGPTGPVDWGSDGSLPLGSKPCIYMAGNAAAWSTNNGNCAATITYVAPTAAQADTAQILSGATMNSTPLQDAFDGPAWANGKAKIKWSSAWTSLTAGTLTPTLGDTGYCACWTYGGPIVAGETLVIVQNVVDSVQNDDRSTGGAMACPAGWLTTGSPVHTFLNSDGMTISALCTRVADASDATALGSDWVQGGGGDGHGGPPTLHFATNSGTWAAPKSVGYQIINLGPSTIDVFSGWVAQAKNTTIAIPDITPGITNATLLTFGSPWNGGNGIAQPPSGYNLYRPGAISGSTSGLMVSWKYLSSGAAVTGQTFAQAVNFGPVFTASLTLHP